MIQTIKAAFSNRGVQAVVVAASSAAISAAVTYKIVSKRLDAEYEEILENEIEQTKKFYSAISMKPSLEELAKGLDAIVVDEVTDLVQQYQGVKDPRPDLKGAGALVQYNKLVTTADQMAGENGNADVEDLGGEEDEEETINVFAREVTASDTLPQAMIDARDSDKPYVITQDEFTDSELGHQQETLTFYADDNVLADEQDMPIDDVPRVVGDEALASFGVGSGDSRVVYVRNERISMDYEIVLHDGNYGEIVHGIIPETPRARRQRPRDE